MITGRPPKPRALKSLEGNKGKRDLTKEATVEFEVKDPGCPDNLPAEAKAEWRRLAPVLIEKGLLTDADRAAFSMYCMFWSIVEDLKNKLALVTDVELQIAKGYIGGLDKMAKQMRSYLQLFGLSPADRMRIKGVGAPKKSKLQEFLDRNNKKTA